MRKLALIAAVLWLSVVTAAWWKVCPLAAEVAVGLDHPGAVLGVTNDGRAAVARKQDENQNESFSGPVEWYDLRTGKHLRSVLSSDDREIPELPTTKFQPIVVVQRQDGIAIVDIWTGETVVEFPSPNQPRSSFIRVSNA